MIDEQKEASDLVAKEQKISHDNAESLTTVNNALAVLHASKAQLRRRAMWVLGVMAWLGVAWTVWAMVHWG